jgi:hypothetical protein
LRVGPKGLAAVVPDVHASCTPLLSAMRERCDAVLAYVAEPSATDLLFRYVSERVTELDGALHAAAGRPMNARNRLELGAVVERCAPELDAARELAELLEESVWAPSIRLSLCELLAESFTISPPADAADTTVVHSRGGPLSLEFFVKPAAMKQIITLGASFIACHAPEGVWMGLDASEARVCVNLESKNAGAASVQEFRLAKRRIIEPTLACLTAALANLGGRLTVVAEAPDPMMQLAMPA